MSLDEALELSRRALELILITSLPVLLTALVIGLVISILQAVTQISEMTLTFIPKMLGVFLVILLFMPWILSKMITFAEQILLRIGG